MPFGGALDIEPLLQRDLRNQNEHDHAGKICLGLAGLAAIAGGKPALGCSSIIHHQQRGTATAINEPKLQAGSPLPAYRDLAIMAIEARRIAA